MWACCWQARGLVVALTLWAWGGDRGDTAIIRAAGQVVKTTSLTHAQTFSVDGPLGTTRIEIEPGRARVAATRRRASYASSRAGSRSPARPRCACRIRSASKSAAAPSAYDTLGY